ncbi:MAG: DUF4091 domain-containing protein [Armatimonadetes bacterium]|nr:DUF4091 domain-containing protein [Armatimonadota bacterium]
MAFPGANGDGYLIYPGKTAKDLPVPTLRLEMIRQGNEDFETFRLLEEGIREATRRLEVTRSACDPHARVTEIVSRVATRLTRWNRDPLAMENARRAALDEIEFVRRQPLALLRTSSQERFASSEKEVSGRLWAESGATVRASLSGGVGTRKIPLHKEPIRGKAHTLYRFAFPLNVPQARLTVTIKRNGKVKTIERLFLKKVPLKPATGRILSDWQSPTDIEKWTRNYVAVQPAADKEMGPCGKLTFLPGAEFPNLRLLEPKGFLDTDWREYGYLVLTFRNPGSSQVALRLKPLDRGGKADDKHYILLEPKETTRYAVRIEDFGVDIANFQGFELWMFQTKEPVTVMVGPVVISPTKP